MCLLRSFQVSETTPVFEEEAFRSVRCHGNICSFGRIGEEGDDDDDSGHGVMVVGWWR